MQVAPAAQKPASSNDQGYTAVQTDCKTQAGGMLVYKATLATKTRSPASAARGDQWLSRGLVADANLAGLILVFMHIPFQYAHAVQGNVRFLWRTHQPEPKAAPYRTAS